LCIIGDYNIPNARWVKDDDGLTDVRGSRRGPHVRVLMETMRFMNIEQYNYIGNKNDSIFDLVLSDLNCDVERCDFPLVPEDGYHPSLLVNIPTVVEETNLSVKHTAKYNYRKANFDHINSKLATIDWNDLLNGKNTNDAVSTFYDVLFSVIDTYTPKKIIKSSGFPIWYRKPTIVLAKMRNKY
jgi:hypothetical protein